MTDHPYPSPPGMITAAEASRLYPVSQASVQEAAQRLGWPIHMVRDRAHAFDIDRFLDWYFASKAWRRELRRRVAATEPTTIACAPPQ